MQVAQRIFQLMEQNGVTKYRLSRDLDISDSLISQWGNGRTSPENSKHLPAIADYFHVSVDYLLGRDESYPVPEPKLELTDDAIEMAKAYEAASVDVKNGVRRFLGLPEVAIKKEKRA